MSNCPKCGCRAQVVKEYYTTYQCGSDYFDQAPPREEIACQIIAELKQQLSASTKRADDATLLARAANNELLVWGTHSIRLDNRWIECDFDTSGLPVLTDEVRAALQKAMGEG